MLCRHTLPLLLFALSFTLSSAAYSHPYAHHHTRPSRSRRNNVLEATNSSVQPDFPESPGGQCPRDDPPSLAELQTMIESHELPKAPSTWALTCLPRGHNPCPPTHGEACSDEGLCAPAGPDVRLRRARHLRLENCPHLTLFSVMSEEERRDLNSLTKCCTTATHLQDRDALVQKFLWTQEMLLKRSNFKNNCGLGDQQRTTNSYNNKMCGAIGNPHCASCEEAYRRWVCSQLFVFYDGEGCTVKPCASICHCVEQKCPYFLPQDKPVAGEPSFLCEDPTVGIMNSATNDLDSRCYEPCSHIASLGHLHEKTNTSDFTLCVHANTKHQLPQDCARSQKCLSSAPGMDCGCHSILSTSVQGTLLTCLLFVALSRTLILRPRGFT